jgi:hypothetical protein
MNQSAPNSCRDSPENAYWNNATATPDQALINAALLPPWLAYSVVGAVTSVFNSICILIFMTEKVRLSVYQMSIEYCLVLLRYGNFAVWYGTVGHPRDCGRRLQKDCIFEFMGKILKRKYGTSPWSRTPAKAIRYGEPVLRTVS